MTLSIHKPSALRRLQADLDDLRRQLGALHDRLPGFQHARQVRLAVTVPDQYGDYPVEANTYWIVFVDGEFPDEAGWQDHDLTLRQTRELPRTLAHNVFDGGYCEPDTLVRVTFHNGRWWFYHGGGDGLFELDGPLTYPQPADDHPDDAPSVGGVRVEFDDELFEYAAAPKDAVEHAGTLTTRTDDDTGVVSVTGEHRLRVGQSADLSWDGGSRTGMDITEVDGQLVTLDGGTGDVLPAAETAVTLTAEDEADYTLWLPDAIRDADGVYVGLPRLGPKLWVRAALNWQSRRWEIRKQPEQPSWKGTLDETLEPGGSADVTIPETSEGAGNSVTITAYDMLLHECDSLANGTDVVVTYFPDWDNGEGKVSGRFGVTGAECPVPAA